MGEDVETYWDGEAWRNRIGGGAPLSGGHPDLETAVSEGAAEARLRGVVHLIRRVDGTVADRRRYPRRSSELPS